MNPPNVWKFLKILRAKEDDGKHENKIKWING